MTTRVNVPATLAEALRILDSEPDATVLAGGTDLMVAINLLHQRPRVVVSLRRIDEGGFRDVDGDWVGAGVTFRRLEASRHLALAQLARTVGSPQIRNVATIGGNLGTASPAGDSLPFLLVADAQVHLQSFAGGERVVPIADFLVGVKRTARRPGELITGVRVGVRPGTPQAFAKVGTRSAMVIAVSSACVLRGPDGWRIAVGSVAPTAIRVPEAEALLAAGGPGGPGGDMLEALRDAVARGVRPIDDHRSTADYRRRSVATIAVRCVERCLVA
jgi:CO/xanthine dehydrogenase FAD-binding subunit